MNAWKQFASENSLEAILLVNDVSSTFNHKQKSCVILF